MYRNICSSSYIINLQSHFDSISINRNQINGEQTFGVGLLEKWRTALKKKKTFSFLRAGESLFESRVEFSKDQYLRILNFILFRHLRQASQVIVKNAKLPVKSQRGWKKSSWDRELFSISSIPSQQTPEKIQLTNFVYL